MRYAWIAIVIVLLDQGVKWALWRAGMSDEPLFHSGALSLQLQQGNHLPLSNVYAALANSTTLVLLLSLVITHLLVTRWSTHSYFISRRTKFGMQLAVAGISSHAIDLLITGQVVNVLRLEIGNAFTINAGIADIALMLGFTLLMLALYQGGSRIRCTMPLAPSDIAPVRFSHLPRGIDNVHIDVLLSPTFCKQANRIINTLLPLVIKHLHQGRHTVNVPKHFFDQLSSQFNALLDGALHQAKSRGDPQLPNLFFIAVLKQLHSEVSNSVSALLQRKKENVQENNRRGSGTQRDIHLVEWMFRHRTNIIALTNLTLLNALCGAQNRTAGKQISNILGKQKIFMQQARLTPLLLAEAGADEGIQLKHYLLLGQQQEDMNSFLRIDNLLSEVLREYLPLVRENPDRERTDKNLVRDSDALSQPSVLMHPANVTILFDTMWSRKKLGEYSPWRDWRKYHRGKHHVYFQQRLRLRLAAELQRSGLAPWINAAYEARTLLSKSLIAIPPATLHSTLARNGNRSELNQRLRDLFKGHEGAPKTEEIVAAWERVHRQGSSLLRENLQRFVHDFARYRHDLLMLFTYQRAAAQLRLLTAGKDLQTSRANYTLYEFLGESERLQADAPILSHIIIKADLRGSTEITQKLTELSLNPATHFDRNFFTPINKLIESYGAEKVFIEGDAVILILNERKGDRTGRLIASHACGLAANILQVVAKQNRELNAYGLPPLEIGIGIANCDEAPRYLFDQQNRITISPAINRADRLSACAWGVRQWRELQGVNDSHVEVYQPSAREMGHGVKAQKELVYNLNGVHIEPAVFARLHHEIAPKPLHSTLPQFADSELFAIAFTDVAGGHHHLVVRKAPLHEYDPEYRASSAPVVAGRYFFEVVHERSTLQQLLKQG